MQIGIISDTHDDLDNVVKAINIFKKNEVELIIHAGDYVFPGVLERINEEFKKLKYNNVKLIGVLGNNDGEKIGLLRAFIEAKGELITDEIGKIIIELDGKKFGVYHGTNKELVNALIQSGKYDVFIYGHTHQRHNEMFKMAYKKTHVINPGTAHKNFPNIDKKIEEKSCVVIYDSKTEDTKFIELNTEKRIEQPLKVIECNE
jgi:putative phosphoesterase